MLLLPYTKGVQALTVNTANTIHGSAPYLTFDGGRTKATDTDTFLAIELPDGRRITPSTNTSSSTNPIMVSTGITFNDIHTVLPSGTTSISLNSLITQGKWGDDDGDGQGAGGVTASGNISLIIRDKDGRTVNRGDTLSKCSAPYRVTLSSSGGSLTTQYGVPNRSTFSGGSATYYIKPDSSGNCYFVERIMPNLRLSRGSGRGERGGWSSTEGFSSAFPTTGADGLYFDLKIPTVLDASQLSWTVNTSGTLNATVSWRLPNQRDNWITDKSRYVTRVTLSGPRADSTQRNSSNPSPLTRPSLPQTFELVGRDRSGNEVRYVFTLSKWFVGRAMNSSWENQRSWCNSLGYRLPRVRELSNSKLGDWQGGTPPRGNIYYTRDIGFFLSEWGSVAGYVNANFGGGFYMTAEKNSQRYPYAIRESDGEVWNLADPVNENVVCTTP
ncbi:hypothetical protein A9G31_00175 [Gilliamella sp. Gris1-4]|nr:hypothetical protein A9G31_00175 [Gilliamella apicola]